MLDDDGLGFNQPLYSIALGNSATINIPTRTKFNLMPHVIIAVEPDVTSFTPPTPPTVTLPWSITIN